MESVYPWYQVAWDLSLDNGMDPKTAIDFKIKIAEEINRDIQTNKIRCWDASGEPVRGGVPFEKQRTCVPHLTTKEANHWLETNGYLIQWTPRQDSRTPESLANTHIEKSELANPEQLLKVFGVWGLKESWFRELSSHQWLLKARKVKGQSHKGVNRQPLYCPYAVMYGLLYEVRKPKISEDKAWHLLEVNFKNVYDMHTGIDPRKLTGD